MIRAWALSARQWQRLKNVGLRISLFLFWRLRIEIINAARLLERKVEQLSSRLSWFIQYLKYAFLKDIEKRQPIIICAHVKN